MICAGVDAGSRAIKVVLLDSESHAVIGSRVTDQGVKQEALALGLLEESLEEAGLNRGDVSRIVATGYGRHVLGFANDTVTEITCHARGVYHLAPEAKTVVDIGGQDSKLIRLDGDGAVRDFVMNDRCAAGTGCFLEMVARKLELTLDQLGDLAGRSADPAVISSMCVVFAETEIIGLLAANARPEDIVAGVQKAIVTRVSAMAGRMTEPPTVFTGGVAMIPGMDAALQSVLGHRVTTAPDPQTTGALGAALLAARPPR